ncbi:MAG: hypothetical protein LC798_19245 [Chloroflexi bacterium]|nr:hypothetical protein [Chloroflexota bacterium]
MTASDEPVEEMVRHPGGAVKYTGFRIGGVMHGAWAWYRTDGSLMRTGTFDRGRQIGTWRTMDRRGKTVKETEFGE